MAEWFEAHYNQEVCFSSAVKGNKGPRTKLLPLLLLVVLASFLPIIGLFP